MGLVLLGHVESALQHREPRPLFLGQPERHPQRPLVCHPVQLFRTNLIPILVLVLRGFGFIRPSSGHAAAAGQGRAGGGQRRWVAAQAAWWVNV